MMIEPAMPTPLEKNRNMVDNPNERPKFLIANHAPERSVIRFQPMALARALPSLVRARMNDLSNSATPPRTVSINLPCGVVVSAQASPRDLKLAPALEITLSGPDRWSQSSIQNISGFPQGLSEALAAD
jgi:hypothetical protein